MAEIAENVSDRWYLGAMERLVGVVQALSQARDVDAVRAIVRDAARSLTGADGATFVLRDGDQCYYVDENAIGPLWKGRRFPMSACISGWVMLNARSAVIEDIYSDSRIPADAYRPTFVKSLAMVPIRRGAPIGAIGNYWATRRRPNEQEVAVLQALADTTSVALENVHLYEDLRGKLQTLQEQRERIDGQRDALEVFTRALAHDLKEPVRSIRAFSEIIGRSDISAQQASQYLNFIQKAADRMNMLVESVFRYTQLDDPQMAAKASCSMPAALEAAKENLAQLIGESGASITTEELPEVDASFPQMIQVLQNLLSNAIRHADGPVTVRIRADERADHWLFAVADSGPGIAPDQAEKIFLPFKRLTHDETGAGLGLAVCRKILAIHGGKIWCESTPGRGATFFFTLPKSAPAVGAQSDSPAATPALARPAAPEVSLAKVLLVDDREDDIELTRHFLFDVSNTDCEVMVALDGAQALDMLEQTSRAGTVIDLMLVDINMPGMDGFELLERLRQGHPRPPPAVLMCTGSTYDKDRQRAEALGAAGYLVKPPSFDQFEALLGEIATVQIHSRDGGNRLLSRAA